MGALPRGRYYWHELIGCPVVDPEGGALGTVRDMYRSGGAEILVVEGGPRGAFDLPVARPFVRILAPRRGEIVADPDALDLPSVDAIRPPRPPRPSASPQGRAIAEPPAPGRRGSASRRRPARRRGVPATPGSDPGRPNGPEPAAS